MKTAVLFLVFNRPDTTEEVFAAIRKAKPERLYVAADGARQGKPEEVALCSMTRQIATAVDWPCELRTLLREENLGCKCAVAGAIDWFFEQEKEGIVIEDDILPAPEFFSFCESMLALHRDNPRVMMISGFNPIGAAVESSDYFFSENPSIWGWACWRDRWASYDINMSLWPSKGVTQKLKSLPLYMREYFVDAFNRTQSGEINTWDYQWTFNIMEKAGVVVKPVANLVSNIGVEGAHTSSQTHEHFIEYGLLEPAMQLSPNPGLAREQDLACYDRLFGAGKSRYVAKHFLRWLGVLKLARRMKSLCS